MQLGDYTSVIVIENTLAYTVDIGANFTFYTSDYAKELEGKDVGKEEGEKTVKHLAPGARFAIKFDTSGAPQEYDAQFNVTRSTVDTADTTKLNASVKNSPSLNYIYLENNCDYAVTNVDYSVLFFGESGKLIGFSEGTFYGPEKDENDSKDKPEDFVIKSGETVSRKAGMGGTKYVVYLNVEKVK